MEKLPEYFDVSLGQIEQNGEIKSETLRDKQEEGQGLVEYALILLLVAIVVISILILLGPGIGRMFSSVRTGIS